jgi:hypothetical protein
MSPEMFIASTPAHWSLGVNFSNILCAALMLTDPKPAKNTVMLLVFFSLLGSTRVKAALKTLMKLTLDDKNLHHPEWMTRTRPNLIKLLGAFYD